MAITQVRANFDGTWYTLTYNSATGLYEGTIRPPSVSGNQPGGYYSLTVEATNASGTTATASGDTLASLRLVVEDKEGPILTVTSPAGDTLTTAETITVSGTASDVSGVQSVTINGAAASLGAGGAFQVTLPLSEGDNPITITATDTVGNPTTITRTVTRAVHGPTLTIINPVDGTATSQTTVLVTGTVSDSVTAVTSVTINGEAVSFAGGTYSGNVDLAEGDNTITVMAVNQAGLSTTLSVSVTLDTEVPQITLTTPAPGQMADSPAFLVTGTVSEQGSGIASLTVNGTQAQVSGGTFSLEINLQEGDNAVTAVVTDRAGNQATAAGSVLLDTLPPALAVTTPGADLITNQPALTVAGTASDSGSGLASVTINGQTVPVTGGAFALELTLQEGANTLTVTAADQVGHTTTVTRTVLLDTQQPVLTLVSPPEGWIHSSQPTITLETSDEPGGSGVDLDTVSITLDGAEQAQGLEITGSTLAFTPQTPLADGTHVLAVTVRDRAGNLRGLSLTYKVDTVPPELAIDQDTLHRVVDRDFFVVTGQAVDAMSGVASVTAAGILAELAEDGHFRAKIDLVIGANQVDVTAADRGGMTTTRSFVVWRLVTDRTAADVARVAELDARGQDRWTEEETAWVLNAPCLRGSYDDRDLNRVEGAVDYISSWADPPPPGHIPWTQPQNLTQTPGTRYLQEVQRVGELFPLPEDTPLLPASMRKLDTAGANAIEKVLVAADSVRPNLEKSTWYCGEIFCGEV